MTKTRRRNQKSPQTGRENGLFLQFKRDLSACTCVRVLCVCAMLAAMSLILGKFLQIPNPFQQIIRISFENLPIILAAIAFGPFMGIMTGVVADLLGCALYGYAVNPLVTVGAGTVGLTAGLFACYLVRRPTALRVCVATVAAHLAGSVLVKSVGLAAWYLGEYNVGLGELILWRLLTYAIVGTLECMLLCALLRHRAVISQLERIRR